MVSPAARRVAFVLKGYPRLSETFIAQEILALENLGLDILIVSLRHPTDGRTHLVHSEIRAPVYYLPEYLHRGPLRVLRAWLRVRRWPAYRQVRAVWLRDLWRDLTANRIRRFGQALVLANELPDDVGRLHAHFLHTPASVVRYAAGLRGMAWTGSAHAKDIWTTPEWELREKLASCEWLVTCTATNCAHLSALAPQGRVELVYHGLDLSRFASSPVAHRAVTARSAEERVTLLSVGRLVEKKGTDVLLDALAKLPRTLFWRLVHVGGGPLRKEMMRRAETLGIADGDRDGLPNVLMEAQTQGMPCVATRVSASHELIEHEVTGLLVPPEAPEPLAAAIEALMTDPALRSRLGEAGRQRVTTAFGMDANIATLATKFGLVPGGSGGRSEAAV